MRKLDVKMFCWITCIVFSLIGIFIHEWAAWTPWMAASFVIVSNMD